jgi:hypothetical protein
MHHQRLGICPTAVEKQLQLMAGSLFKQQGSSHAAAWSKATGISIQRPYIVHERRNKIL